ncbi:hypothetical protein Acsp01_65250 [Actinoplanes sp. NBRC 101535]|nr:hypothetical protein Acsp01_65250 [Actinoplanes sp. NBRC 101535]
MPSSPSSPQGTESDSFAPGYGLPPYQQDEPADYSPWGQAAPLSLFEEPAPHAGRDPLLDARHRRPGMGSRGIRVAVAAGAVAALIGAGFLLTGGDQEETTTPVAAPATPSTTEVEVPDLTPASPSKASPSASASASPTPSKSPSPSASTVVTRPAVHAGSRTPTRKATSAAPEDSGAAVLSAFYSYSADTDFVGTVQVVNAGDAAADDWTVTMTVPGGENVAASGGVQVSQSGTRVTFHGSSVAAGGSSTFSFTLGGAPSALPTGCTIDGTACA